MIPTTDKCQADVLRLTKTAVEAAELGRWDVVIQCYRDRGALLETMQTSVRKADDLLKLDGQIRDRVNTVQAVLTALLGEATATRQRLQGLRQKLDLSPSVPEALSVKA